MNKTRAVTLVVMLVTSMVLAAERAGQAAYDPCFAPATVGIGTKPNVLLVMDFSGSMNFVAYTNNNNFSYFHNGTTQCYSSGASGEPSKPCSFVANQDFRDFGISIPTAQNNPDVSEYDPLSTYYGNFDSDNYYAYNSTDPANLYFEKSTDPSLPGYISMSGDSVENADGSITFKATGHGFAVGDVVAFQGLSAHTKMNAREGGGGYTVMSVSGDQFSVKFTANAVPLVQNGGSDKADGAYVIKRVIGSTITGVSGNVLNFLTTSRISAAMKALIGGKADCDDTYCYLRLLGSRRVVRSNVSLVGSIYIRPGTVANSSTGAITDPEAFKTGRFVDKDMFISFWGDKKGELKTTSATSKKYGVNRYAEYWSFKPTVPSTVGSDPKEARIRISVTGTGFVPHVQVRVTNPDGTLFNDGPGMVSGNTVTLDIKPTVSQQYSLEITSNADFAVGTYTLQIQSDAVQPLPWPAATPAVHNGASADGTIGSLDSAAVRVRVVKTDRRGVIQNTFENVRYGFMMYRGDGGGDNKYQGKMLIGTDNDDMDKLVNAIQGRGSDGSLDFGHVFPYYGTPTGDAMEQAYQYYRHQSGMDSTNTTFNTADRDPYKDGTNWVPCRKSFVFLISDGEYTTTDPIVPVVKLRRGGTSSTPPASGIRSDIIVGGKTQQILVKTYSMYCFNSGGDAYKGQRSMEWIGMFGAFNDNATSACGSTGLWPYSRTNYPSGTSTTAFSVTNCCTENASYDPVPVASPNSCCQEWDANADGVPDGYYYVSSGTDMENAILSALDQIKTATSSASSVAAAPQQTGAGDFLIRGAFDARDPNNETAYLWRGHLEVFWSVPKGERERLVAMMKAAALDPEVEAPCLMGLAGRAVNGEPICYDVDFKDNYDQLCKDLHNKTATFVPKTRHCWDAAEQLAVWLADNDSSERKIFTGIDRPDASSGKGDGRVTGGSVDVTKSYNMIAVNGTEEVIAFESATAATLTTLTPLFNLDTSKFTTLAAQQAEADRIIRWTRGEFIDLSTFRNRQDDAGNNWVLGDIAYSTPLLVGTPSIGSVDPRDPNALEFYAYRNKVLDNHRYRVVYVGANDGMVHAFIQAVWSDVASKYITEPNRRPDDEELVTDEEKKAELPINKGTSDERALIGTELWAYIPSNLLSELQDLKDPTYGSGGCTHRAMVDLSPRAWDVYLYNAPADDYNPNVGGGPAWRTILIGGERGGGDVYFCLDVTDPQKPRLLWEYSVLRDRIVVETGTTAAKTTGFLGTGDPNSVGRTAQGVNGRLAEVWYFTVPTAGATVQIDTSSDVMDIFTYLYKDTNGDGYPAWSEKIAYDDDSGPGYSSQIKTTLTAGTYFIEVTSWGDWGPYGNGGLYNITMSGATLQVSTTKYPSHNGNASGASTRLYQPFDDQYDLPSRPKKAIKLLPMSWTAPYVGRIKIPAGVSFYTGPPNTDGLTPSGVFPYKGTPLTTDKLNRAVIFAGGTPRVFNLNDVEITTSPAVLKERLWDPQLMMIDIETGQNLLKYNWPFLVATNRSTYWPNKDVTISTTSNRIPYALSDPVALDMTRVRAPVPPSTTPTVEAIQDGFIDHVYFGDLNGLFYGVTLRHDLTTGPFISLNLWRTKQVQNLTDPNKNLYRSDHQPIVDMPGASWATDLQNMRLIFGTGKYENVYNSGADDKSDKGKMGLYNLLVPADLAPSSATDVDVFATGATFEVSTPCGVSEFLRDGCVWVRSDGTKDCCQGSGTTCPTDPCFDCVYEFGGGTDADGLSMAGERVTGKPLVVGQLVFITTFVPRPDPTDPTGQCSSYGQGYLYAFDYQCQLFPFGYNPFAEGGQLVGGIFTGGGSETTASGSRLQLNAGVPSRAVMDSSGTQVIVQSGGEVITKKVNLRMPPEEQKGWTVR